MDGLKTLIKGRGFAAFAIGVIANIVFAVLMQKGVLKQEEGKDLMEAVTILVGILLGKNAAEDFAAKWRGNGGKPPAPPAPPPTGT